MNKTTFRFRVQASGSAHPFPWVSRGLHALNALKKPSCGLFLAAFWLLASSLTGCGDDDKDDLVQPQLTVAQPLDGAEFGLGQQVPISFEASDDVLLDTWVISVVNENFGSTVWTDSEQNIGANQVSVNRTFTISAGDSTLYSVTVSVSDASQNEAIEVRNFYGLP
ncbi:MAG: hypothetical protein GC205_02300 [Bacteroidetes bacterium]|nr:hypothetical protein [Bacteroidota bacterium]